MSYQPGQIVRLRHNPAKVGTLTSTNKRMGQRMHWLVHFPAGFEHVPEDQLEPADVAPDPHELLRNGTLSSARDLRRVLTHARLSGHLADYLYSLETTRTTYFPHQFKPVLKLLSSVGDGILIADEVGLGKTIEAGLIWTELKARFEYRRLFVLCPAVLKEKWRDELSSKFGVRAETCDAAGALDRLRGAASDLAGESFALIGSMQGLRPRGEDEEATDPMPPSLRLARFLSDREGEEPLIDLLVIDEAHHLRNTETATAKVGRLLRAVSTHVVLLTATPINLRNDDLFSLVRLIDQDTFVGIGEFEDILTANGPLVHARRQVLEKGVTRAELVELLEHARQHPILSGNQTLGSLVSAPPSDEELRTHRVRAEVAHLLDQANLLGQVINRTRKRDVQEHRIERRAVDQRVSLSPIEAEFYERVTEIVRSFCQGRNASEGFILSMPQRQMASSIPAAFRHWSGQLESGQFNLLAGLEDEEEELVSDGKSSQRTPKGDLVRELVGRVHSLGPYDRLKQSDSKYRKLHGAVRDHLKRDPDAKLVLFSSFRETLGYLSERLREDDIPTLLMTGDTESKQATIDAFRQHAGGMVLLSSEVGSEGVDLQFSRVIVNYDLPWNPMRVEQRIGRLDRIGQMAKVVAIWNFFSAGTIDEQIYERLYLRIGIFEQALGGLEPILGEQVPDLTWQLLRDTLTPEEEVRRIEAAAQAIEVRRTIEEDLERNASQFFALGDYLLDQVKAASELGRRIADLDVMNYVVEFLRQHHPDSRLEPPDSDPLRMGVLLSPGAKVALEQFMSRARLATPTRLTLFSAAPVACRFRNVTVDSEAPGAETINQFHPLVRYAREVLREAESDLRLTVAAGVKDDFLQSRVPAGTYVFAVDRWAVTGVQVTEKLAYAAIDIGTGATLDEDVAELLVNMTASAGEEWLSAAGDLELEVIAEREGAACLLQLADRYEKHIRTALLQNEDRADALIRTLDRQVEGQSARIQATIDARLARGKTGLVAADRARIAKLEERAEMRRIRYRTGAEIKTERTHFLMGVVRVHA